MKKIRVAPEIYRDAETGSFYERPRLNGRRTWRKLDGHNLTTAKACFIQRRSDLAKSRVHMAEDPYKQSAPTVAKLIEQYATDDHREQSRIKQLLRYFANRKADEISLPADARAYFTARKKSVRYGHGGRAVDLELATLRKILNDALERGSIDRLPVGAWPKFRQKVIRHCRESAPENADELHSLARHLFEDPRSEVLGWQLLVTALTGCRVSEVLRLRWDAQRKTDPGYIDQGGWIWISRSKNGCNPFVKLTDDLRECLEAMREWRISRKYAAASPFWFPSPRVPDQPVDPCSLTHALVDAGHLVLDRKITAHGLRSYFVTVRRSEGISDAQIAAEIGDKSGAAIIVSTYGAIPPGWRGGPSIAWKPAGAPPAWLYFRQKSEQAPSFCPQLPPERNPSKRLSS